MSGTLRTERERLLELLADEALGCLAASERSELDHLLARHRDVPRRVLMETVAEADLAIAARDREPLPPSLRDRILRATAQAGESRSAPKGLRRLHTLVYLAAAAVVLTGFLFLLKTPRETFGDRSLAAAQLEVDRLVARAHDVKRWNWKAGPDPLGTGSGMNGEVVWSSEEQRGFMVFHGLKANEAKAEQYQLWIFDKTRDDRYPVDGGVFDCEGPDAIVPIEAKIRVTEPALFAVTVEKPGGVVVSDRSRIAALAQP